MIKNPDERMKAAELRRQAEELLRMTERDVAAMPVKDVPQLVRELQVIQIERDIQREELRRVQGELEAARVRYAEFYDCSPAGHLVLNRDGMVVEANRRAATLLGVNGEDLIGQLFRRFVASEDQERLHLHCQVVLKTGTRHTCNVRLQETAGGICHLYLESVVVHGGAGGSGHWRTSVLDVSDLKQREQELEAQRTQLDAIIETAMEGIITVDEGGRVLVFNQAAQSMFGCSAAEAMGQSLSRFIPERFSEALYGHMGRVATDGVGSRVIPCGEVVFGLRSNGETFPIEALISQVLLAGKTLFTVMLRNVATRVLGGGELERQGELEILTGKLIEEQEQERKRIARELHDDFNQRLAMFAVKLETLEGNSIAFLPELIHQQLADIRAGIGWLSDDLHSLAYKLHPSLLDHVGLEVAMRDHIVEFANQTGLSVTFIPREVPKALSPEVKTSLFRIMQESLQNVFQHAQASEVLVRLSGSQKGIGLLVRDNGRGSGLEGKAIRVKGLGFTSLQERARLLGGVCRMDSGHKKGTQLCVWIPYSQEGA